LGSEGFRCADAAEQRDEPLYGTASFVKRWLLLEQPGSWGGDALMESRLATDTARALRAKARAAGVRIILIRRGVRLSSDRRQCYFVRTDGCDLYQAHLDLDDVDDLVDIDLGPLADGSPIPEAVEHNDPLFLICTHGRHDQCCSIRGNQVSRVACAHPTADAWECSHIGGDRFAANLVCFPHGLYYGRVSPADVTRLMDDFAGGTLSLKHYRGRCCHLFPVQAAEYFARRETGITLVDDVSLEATVRTASGVAATFSLSDGRSAVVEVSISKGPAQRLTCGAGGADPVPIYDLVSCSVT
jgi:hypothetical protein